MFDTVHAGHHCGQVKGWRKAGDDIFIGDTVDFLRQSWGVYAEEYWPDPSTEPPITYTNNMYGSGWLVVVDGVLVDWADEPGDGPRYGHPRILEKAEGAAPTGFEDECLPGDCNLCAAVRDGRTPRPPKQWRDISETFADRRKRQIVEDAAAQDSLDELSTTIQAMIDEAAPPQN